MHAQFKVHNSIKYKTKFKLFLYIFLCENVTYLCKRVLHAIWVLLSSIVQLIQDLTVCTFFFTLLQTKSISTVYQYIVVFLQCHEFQLHLLLHAVLVWKFNKHM